MGTALRLMRQQGIRHLLVLDEGKLVGILSDRDLRSPEVPGRWHAIPWADSLAVESVMSSPVMVLSPDAALSDAARLMHDERIDCAPVVEDQTIVGIITSSDLLQILANEEGRSPVPN